MLTLQVLKQIPCQKGDYNDPGAISLFRTIVSVCTCVCMLSCHRDKNKFAASPQISRSQPHAAGPSVGQARGSAVDHSRVIAQNLVLPDAFLLSGTKWMS